MDAGDTETMKLLAQEVIPRVEVEVAAGNRVKGGLPTCITSPGDRATLSLVRGRERVRSQLWKGW